MWEGLLLAICILLWGSFFVGCWVLMGRIAYLASLENLKVHTELIDPPEEICCIFGPITFLVLMGQYIFYRICIILTNIIRIIRSIKQDIRTSRQIQKEQERLKPKEWDT
jgi:hypothetical protein